MVQVGLAHAAVVLPAWLDRAAREELPYADFLQGLLEEDASARAQATTQRRLRDAAFPFAATIEQFDFRFRPELKRQLVLRDLDPTFVEQARSLALIGAPGLGKTIAQGAPGNLHRHQARAAGLHRPVRHRPKPGHQRRPATPVTPAARVRRAGARRARLSAQGAFSIWSRRRDSNP